MLRSITGVLVLLSLFSAGTMTAVADEKDATMGAIWVPVSRLVIAPPVGVVPKRSAVAFPHSRHFSYSCNTCHHKWDGRTQVKSCLASNCHNRVAPPEKGSQIPAHAYYKNAFHQSCIRCHKDIKSRNEKLAASGKILTDRLPRTGPTGCVQCHPKAG